MHGIFVGEIQALEGAGRTCWDFDTGNGRDEAPFELKLDMARQCWDEARHVEISVKLTEHMGSEIGEFARADDALRGGVQRRPGAAPHRRQPRARRSRHRRVQHHARLRRQPPAIRSSYFCEDWMLADEVTHVKMGSDWLRRITAKDPERQQGGPRLPAHRRQALQLRRLPGRGGGEPDPPRPDVPQAGRLHRRRDHRARRRGGRGLRRGASRECRRAAAASRGLTCLLASSSTIHKGWAWVVIIGNGLAGAVGARRAPASRRCAPARCGGSPSSSRSRSSCRWARRRHGGGPEHRSRRSSTCSTGSSPSSPSASSTPTGRPSGSVSTSTCSTAAVGLFLMGLGIRALLVGRT